MTSFAEKELVDCLPALRRFALSLTRSPSDADDLVQDTVERAIARSSHFTAGTNLRAWLFTICRNHFLTGRRKHAAQGEQVAMEDMTADLPVAPAQEDRLLMRDLVRSFSTLSQVDQDVITTVAIGGMRYDEAARQMRVEVGTVKSRVSRARARLTAAMQGEVAFASAA